MHNFADIVKANGGAVSLANKLGVKVSIVYAWEARNSIPAKYWLKMIERLDVACPSAHDMAVMAAAG